MFTRRTLLKSIPGAAILTSGIGTLLGIPSRERTVELVLDDSSTISIPYNKPHHFDRSVVIKAWGIFQDGEPIHAEWPNYAFIPYAHGVIVNDSGINRVGPRYSVLLHTDRGLEGRNEYTNTVYWKAEFETRLYGFQYILDDVKQPFVAIDMLVPEGKRVFFTEQGVFPVDFPDYRERIFCVEFDDDGPDLWLPADPDGCARLEVPFAVTVKRIGVYDGCQKTVSTEKVIPCVAGDTLCLSGPFV